MDCSIARTIAARPGVTAGGQNDVPASDTASDRSLHRNHLIIRPLPVRRNQYDEDEVIVEIKAVGSVAPVHKKQLLTYLELADKRLGLLINFNVALIKDGITRIVNGLQE